MFVAELAEPEAVCVPDAVVVAEAPDAVAEAPDDTAVGRSVMVTPALAQMASTAGVISAEKALAMARR